MDVLAWMAIEVLRISQHTEHESMRLLLLYVEDVYVQARARPDGLLEESPELTEAGVVGSMCISKTAVPADTETL